MSVYDAITIQFKCIDGIYKMPYDVFNKIPIFRESIDRSEKYKIKYKKMYPTELYYCDSEDEHEYDY